MFELGFVGLAILRITNYGLHIMNIELNKEDEKFIQTMKQKSINVTRSELADVGDIILNNIK